MTFDQAIVSCFKKYAVFKGRAPRSEYWWFVLFIFLAEAAAVIVDVTAGTNFIADIVELAFLLPQLAVSVRRLHDINRSGWWIGGMYILLLVGLAVMAVAFGMSFQAGTPPQMSPIGGMVFALFGLVAFIYGITLFIFTLTKGTRGPNNYGPDPLASPLSEAAMQPSH
ncbi:MAG TPA: DUF805 domain-containing protein [Rhizomicrobium sp.]|nr:DUF805 domain-containing protein [Rhizomicrobium sp.]